jgi:hypothetical protein
VARRFGDDLLVDRQRRELLVADRFQRGGTPPPPVDLDAMRQHFRAGWNDA